MASQSNRRPFKVEYARSNQSTCKRCRLKIDADSLRLARVLKSALFEGNQLNWFHSYCFFDVHRPLSAGDIDGFENIRNIDQLYIRSEIDKRSKLVEFVPSSSSSNGPLRAKMSAPALLDFGVEYAKSGRAMCRHCEQKIRKDDVRVKKLIYDSDVGMKFGGEPLWYHLICFAKVRHTLGWLGSGDQLPGYRKINSADRRIIDTIVTPSFKSVDQDQEEVKPEFDSIKPSQLKQLRAQNDVYFKNRDFCQKKLDNQQVVAILRMNHQDVPRGRADKLDAIADSLTFGALERCPKCSGQLYLSNGRFVCRGYLTETESCDYSDDNPERREACVPSKIRSSHRFLDRDYPPRKRLFYNLESRMPFEPVDKKMKME